MTQAVTVRRDGDTFQARLFWWYAARLLDHQSPIVRVGFENGPKSFDDIWVEYDPSRSALDHCGEPVRRDHIQCKWHVAPDIYGFSHLIDPAFVNANARSLLERAHDALKGSCFYCSAKCIHFFLGQRQPSLGPLRLYEFDFEGSRDRSYVLALTLPAELPGQMP